MSAYYEGTTVKIVTTTAFASLLETPPLQVSPETVILDVMVDGGPIAQYLWTSANGDPTETIVNYGPGQFYALLDTTGQIGQWQVQLWGSGIVTALAYRTFTVREKPIPIAA